LLPFSGFAYAAALVEILMNKSEEVPIPLPIAAESFGVDVKRTLNKNKDFITFDKCTIYSQYSEVRNTYGMQRIRYKRREELLRRGR